MNAQIHEWPSDQPIEGRSAEEIAWRYGCTCVEGRKHMESNIAWEDVASAKTHMLNQTLPTPEEIRRWLPKPFLVLERDGERVTPQRMLEYWRWEHSGPDELTPVRVACVLSINKLSCWVQHRQHAASEQVLNVHCLQLEVGQWVRIHNGIIAETCHDE